MHQHAERMLLAVFPIVSLAAGAAGFHRFPGFWPRLLPGYLFSMGFLLTYITAKEIESLRRRR